MKTLKILSGIMCGIGVFLIIGAIGQDDFNTIVLQQAHPINWIQIIIGVVMVLQFAMISNVRKKYERKGL